MVGKSPATCGPWSCRAPRAVKRAAEGKGLDRVFIDAGFEWGEPGCGLCPGLGGVTLARGDRCVSTSNRNFVGRQGIGVRTHLAGAATAALAAIEGAISDVRGAESWMPLP